MAKAGKFYAILAGIKQNLIPIYPDIIQSWYSCKDGHYSDHAWPGACRWHGGLLMWVVSECGVLLLCVFFF